MLQIAGIAVVFIMVFGGFVLAGGHFEVILHSLPYEMMMIGGAGLGAFLLSSSGGQAKATAGSFGKVFAGPKWKTQDYRDLLSLLFTVTKTMKSKGMIALEPHIENPKESAIFKLYPKIIADHFALDFICDTLRMMTMSLEDPHQVETAMEKQLEKHHHESSAPAHAMQSLADGLPALGIVAAVLGGMIGGALVGTFLGVFLAYGFIGPMASRLKYCYDEEALFYHVIRDILVAHLHGNSAQVSVEIGRGSVPSDHQPSFMELEEALKSVPNEA